MTQKQIEIIRNASTTFQQAAHDAATGGVMESEYRNLAVALEALLAERGEMLVALGGIAGLIRTQDNRCAAHPIFTVQQKRRDYGYDPDYSDDIAWLIDGDAVTDQEEIQRLNEQYENDAVPGDYTRTAYVDRWEFVTACFTEQGCKDYIAANGHNLKEPRIYVESGYRNAEWQSVLKALSAIDAAMKGEA